MFLKKRKVKNNIYWSIVENYRSEGKVKQKTIQSLGNTQTAYNILKNSKEFSCLLKSFYAKKEKKAESPVFSVNFGDNSDLIKNVTDLYMVPGQTIADVTFGKGTFWKKTGTKYNVIGSDLKSGIDFRHLPYPDDSFDHSVIDPPYARISNLKGMVDCYNTSRFVTHDDIIDLYESGLRELYRITKNKGFILCKCQDEIEGGVQKYSHIEILRIAESIGLYGKDLFLLINGKASVNNAYQLHSRKKHSYLWVFEVRK